MQNFLKTCQTLPERKRLLMAGGEAHFSSKRGGKARKARWISEALAVSGGRERRRAPETASASLSRTDPREASVIDRDPRRTE